MANCSLYGFFDDMSRASCFNLERHLFLHVFFQLWEDLRRAPFGAVVSIQQGQRRPGSDDRGHVDIRLVLLFVGPQPTFFA